MPESIIGNLIPREILENPDAAEGLDQLDAIENQAVEARLALIRRVYAEEGGLLENNRGALARTANRLKRRPQYIDNLLTRHGAQAPRGKA